MMIVSKTYDIHTHTHTRTHTYTHTHTHKHTHTHTHSHTARHPCAMSAPVLYGSQTHTDTHTNTRAQTHAHKHKTFPRTHTNTLAHLYVFRKNACRTTAGPREGRNGTPVPTFKRRWELQTCATFLAKFHAFSHLFSVIGFFNCGLSIPVALCPTTG